MKRRKTLLSVVPLALVGIVAMAGCATTTPAGPFEPENSSSPTPTEAPVSVGEPEHAIELVGLWRVELSDAESTSSYLRLDARDAILVDECGVGYGSWRVAGNDVVMSIGAVASAAGEQAVPGCESTDASAEENTDGAVGQTIPWADTVASYASAGDNGFELLDSAGETVATLLPDGKPEPTAAIPEELLSVPEITADTEQWFAQSAPLPADATAASDLVGRWVPTEKTGDLTEPFVDFASDGSYEASDGCNGGAGRWMLGDNGVFLATSGPSTLMFCEGAAVPQWVAEATIATSATDAAGVETVTLLDATGAEIGALVRS